MQRDRKQTIDQLLNSFEAYYNVLKCEEEGSLKAVCEFFQHANSYVISKKAEIWSADCEEFLYLFSLEELTLEEYHKLLDFAREDGMKRAHIQKGHMYTYITPVFVCDRCSEDALTALKKCRIRKNFRFSLDGWMEVHTVLISEGNGAILSNPSGSKTARTLDRVLNPKAKKQHRHLWNLLKK